MRAQKVSRTTFPAYRQALSEGSLAAKVAAARDALRECRLCPRRCGADRLAGSVGFCRTAGLARVSSWGPHGGEEACLSGRRGSGTIFFNWCNLRCVFCQNHDISQSPAGREMGAEDIAALMLGLEARGCHNVNLVTPSHVVPQLLEAVEIAASRGLRIPLVYNTNGYDSPEALALLDGVVDIYMPDFKLWDGGAAFRYLEARDYPEVARAAIREMHRQTGPLELDGEGLARRGVLVRHLVMPGLVEESRAIFRFLAEVSPETYVNILAQYHPAHRAPQYPELDRLLSRNELREACDAALAAGLRRFDR